MKLFESIMNYFDNDNLGLLGAVLGEHEAKVRDGVEAAVPEVLLAIGSRLESPEGRGMLWRELRDTDDSVSSSFSSQLHYQNSLPLVDKGKQQLAGLIGKDADEIAARVSHAADIGSTSASKIVGAVSPLIFSSLAERQRKEDVDGERWQQIFSEQSEGLRERAAYANRRRNDDSGDQQKTFPNFDNSHDGRHAERKSRPAIAANPGASSFATGGAAAAAAGVTAAAGATAAGVVASSKSSVGSAGSANTAAGSSKSAKPAAGSLTTAGSASSGGSVGTAAGSGDSDQPRRWVPDTENLKRERERTAIVNARAEREARLANEKSGGLGWLLWQLPLLAALAFAGWFFRGEISNAFSGATSGVSVDTDSLDGPSVASTGQSADNQDDVSSTVDAMTPQIATSTNRVTDPSAPTALTDDGAMLGSLESTDGENATPELSSLSGTPLTPLKPILDELPSAQQDGNAAAPPAISTTPDNEKASGDSTTPDNEKASGDPMTSDSETAPGDTTTPEDEVKLAPAGDTSQSSETVVVPPTGGEDFDSQVETALTSLELDLKKIKNKATAKSAMSSLEKSVDSLEGVLKKSDSWGDVDRELIEFQLSDAEETFAKLKKTSFSKPKVKGVLKPLFERLEKLLENK